MAPFHSSLKPADELTSCEGVHGSIDHIGFAEECVGKLAAIQVSFDRMRVVFRSKKRRHSTRYVVVSVAAVDDQRRTDRKPGVPGIDWHEYAFEDARCAHERREVGVVKETATQTQTIASRSTLDIG